MLYQFSVVTLQMSIHAAGLHAAHPVFKSATLLLLKPGLLENHKYLSQDFWRVVESSLHRKVFFAI